MENKKDVSVENDNSKLVELINKRFKEAAKYRETFEDEWKECEDFYNGKHWKDKNRSYKNLVFPLVEQEVAVLSDALPSTDILARKAEREEDAKVLEASVHYTYEKQNLFLKYVMARRSSLKNGTGFIYVDYDPDAESGQGITTLKNVDWRHVFLDPSSSEIDDGFVGIKFPTRIEEAKRKYPDFADQIEALGQDSQGLGGTNAKGMKESQSNYLKNNASSEEKFKIEGMCEIEEAWLRDYAMEQVSEEETIKEIEKETDEFFKGLNADIGRFENHPEHIAAHQAQLASIVSEALQIDPAMITEADIESLKEDPELGLIIEMIQDHIRIHEQYLKINPKGERPKYENHLRLVIKIGNIVVYDGNSPVNDDGMVPLVPFYCYKDNESIWATGEVKNILPAQKSFNEMDNAEYESLHLTSNPGWEIESDSGVKPETLTNKRGLVIVKNKGSLVQRLQPGQTSPQLSMRKESDQRFMQIITGMNEASQGRQPGGITAAAAIERLQQQTNGRIRLKSSSDALYSMPKLGLLVARRNAKYWTTERYMRVSDSSTGQVKLIKFDPEAVKDLDYDIRVTQSSLAGSDKEAMARVMETYVDKQWIPPKVYFQIIDVPNKAKILEALEQADQQNALLQQLQMENEQLKAAINGVPVEPSMPTETAPQA